MKRRSAARSRQSRSARAAPVKRAPTKAKRRSKVVRSNPALRWNPDPDDVQRSVIKLVLTLVELIRKLMEHQAVRRMDENTLTAAETEAIGKALMEIERTIRDIGKEFDLTPEDLNLDLGTIKLF
jgi:hypothetical protein